ncbi:hypothetical protein LJR230_001356 [Trinickia sp. LjRoot230]|uniref:hypothetical protein n=1 Tax=Trinickia sp. LjRoot230 TaxID=3342288 RepID=UPI003ECF806E
MSIRVSQYSSADLTNHQTAASNSGYRSAAAKPVPHGPIAAALARLSQRLPSNTRPNNIALMRSVDPVSDGDEFDKVIDEQAGKFADTFSEGMKAGLTPQEAEAKANEAVGRTDPKANFSASSAHGINSPNNVALRGDDTPSIPVTSSGDGSEFGGVIGEVDKIRNFVEEGYLRDGHSEEESQDAANAAVGKTDPAANFSARRFDLSGLATALRLKRSSEAQSSGSGNVPRPRRAAFTPRFA